MFRSGIVKTNFFLLSKAKRGSRRSSKLAGADRPGPRNSAGGSKIEDSSVWIPHTRTGIYFPKGHESVMDDVPVGAATFNQTHWLRSVDGVEEPYLNTPPDDHFRSVQQY